MLTVLLGGARSGKSRFAVELAGRAQGVVRFIATAPHIDGDDDFEDRIERHRRERPAHWVTIEEPLDLSAALAAGAGDVVVIDCLGLWVNNRLWRGDHPDAIETAARADALAAKRRTAPTIVVSNEVGSGVHPGTDTARRFCDCLGRVNQIWVDHADRAALMVAGRAIDLMPLDDLDAGWFPR